MREADFSPLGPNLSERDVETSGRRWMGTGGDDINSGKILF